MNTNRRSIFKLIAGAACAAAMEITGLKPVMPRAAIAVPNPAYFNAEYESVFIFNQHYFEQCRDSLKHANITRYEFIDGQYKPVSQYTTQTTQA